MRSAAVAAAIRRQRRSSAAPTLIASGRSRPKMARSRSDVHSKQRCSLTLLPRSVERTRYSLPISARPPGGPARPTEPGRRWPRCWRPRPSRCRRTPSIELESSGVILICGRDETAVEAGNLLKDHLDVTVLIEPPAAIAPPRSDRFSGGERQGDRRQGSSRRVRGHGRRFRGGRAVLARRVDLRALAQQRPLDLRHHS